MKKSVLFLLTLSLFACTNNTSDKKETKEEKTADNPINSKEISCAAVIIEILESSAVFKEETEGLQEAIVKNGGTSFGIGIDASPYPENDGVDFHSENYELNLHESYADREVVIDRFMFNLGEMQLYQYNVIEDEYIPIDFDTSLTKKFIAVCE